MMTTKEAALKAICVLTESIVTEDLTFQDLEYLKVAEDIIRQVRADGAPFFPIKNHLEKKLQEQHGAGFDLDECINYYMHDQKSGQHVFKGDSTANDCSLCGESYSHGDHEPDYTY